MRTVMRKIVSRGRLIDETLDEVRIEVFSHRDMGSIEATIGFRTRDGQVFFEEAAWVGSPHARGLKIARRFSEFLDKLGKAFQEAAEKMKDEIGTLLAEAEERKLKEKQKKDKQETEEDPPEDE